MPQIRFATASIHPGLHEDDHPLLDELRRRGVTFDCGIWDDASVGWSSAQVTMIRSTWDYHRRRDAFVAWAARAGAATRLFNPPAVIAWNTAKSYLRALASEGVPTVPTAWVAQGERADLKAIVRERGWETVVVKPVVSAGAFATIKAERGELARAQAHLDELTAREAAMVQPYLRTVEDHGERSMLFLDGVLSHAVRKQPAFRPKTAEGDPVTFSDAEAEAAKAVLAAAARLVPEARDPLYARVDIVPDQSGRLVLMELEMTEPTLFLREGGAPAVARLADGLLRRLRG